MAVGPAPSQTIQVLVKPRYQTGNGVWVPAQYATKPNPAYTQWVAATNAARAAAPKPLAALPPPTIQQGTKSVTVGSGEGTHQDTVPNMVPNPAYQSAIAQTDPLGALQLAANAPATNNAADALKFSPLAGLAQNQAPTSTVVGPDGKTYYYAPSSWQAGGGGNASITPGQAAALGGTPFTQHGYVDPSTPLTASGASENAKVDPATNALLSGYLYNTNPNLMPTSTGVKYTPGTGSKEANIDAATIAAFMALPVAAVAAPGFSALAGAGAAEGAAGAGGAAGAAEGVAPAYMGTGMTAASGGGLTAAGTAEGAAGLGGLGAAAPAASSPGVLGTGLTTSQLGTAAGGASTLGGVTGLTSGGGTSSDPSALNYEMPGAGAVSSGATGGAAPGGGSGLGSLANLFGTGVSATQALGILGSLGTLAGGVLGAGSHPSTAVSGTPTASGGGTGGPLPVRAPMNRVQTPYPGDYKTYGQTASPLAGGAQWNFFNPAAQPHAHGGLIAPHQLGPLSSLPPRHMRGPGGGQDDLIDAKVADGEYVVDSSTVSDLGDGSNDQGAAKLDQLVKHVRQHKRGGARGLPPKAKSPLAYIGSKAR